MVFTERISHLAPEGAYQVLAHAQQLEAEGREIIHLEIGQPDFETFANVAGAGIEAITQGKTRYNPPAGVQELRQAIAEDVGKRRGIAIAPEQVVVSPGAKPSLFFPTMALVSPGDEVLYPDPGFPTYPAMIGIARGVPIPVPLVEERDFSFDLDAFDRLINERTRMIILNSPGNPTGGVMPMEDLEHIAEAARDYDCWVLSDEIYARFVYDGRSAPSIAALNGMLERTIIVDGFSKTFSMTGWRLGYGVMPEALAEKVELLLTHSVGCTAHFTQFAGIEALMGPQEQVDKAVASFEQRRNFLTRGLNALPGVRCQKPMGAFYAFPNVQDCRMNVRDLAATLLEEAGVALLPGTAFGVGGDGHLRLSYATELEKLEKALERMKSVFEELAV